MQSAWFRDKVGLFYCFSQGSQVTEQQRSGCSDGHNSEADPCAPRQRRDCRVGRAVQLIEERKEPEGWRPGHQVLILEGGHRLRRGDCLLKKVPAQEESEGGELQERGETEEEPARE